MKCEGECEVWSVEWRVESVKRGVCGAWSVEYGVEIVKCEVRSVE